MLKGNKNPLVQMWLSKSNDTFWLAATFMDIKVKSSSDYGWWFIFILNPLLALSGFSIPENPVFTSAVGLF